MTPFQELCTLVAYISIYFEDKIVGIVDTIKSIIGQNEIEIPPERLEIFNADI